MPELVSSVRLLNGRWVGTCPDCQRDDVPMKLWEHELRVHNTKPRRGVRCSGSGKTAVNVHEVSQQRMVGISQQRMVGFIGGLIAKARMDTKAETEPASILMWAEDGPGQHCAVWKGDRIYIVREGDEWIIKRPGWPKSDIRIDGRHTLLEVQHAVARTFTK